LLVALIPGLLMLATFGLERLETGLNRDTVSATDVDEFLEQALHQSSQDHVPAPRNGRTAGSSVAGLPTRLYAHHGVNPEFRPTQHADRV
jgi:hypothetical protein